jgi:glycosyltransferase involved in cell wall biosynthesis
MLDDFTSSMKCRPIAYVFHPSFADYLELFDRFKLVYHADDTFSAMPGWNDEYAQRERALAARADLIIASSRLIARSLPLTDNRLVRVISNGADTLSFASGAGQTMPTVLSKIPAPRIGYIGNINDKVDLPLLAAIALARPDWHWCIVGHIVPLEYFCSEGKGALALCRSLKNVHFLGAYPTKQLPGLVNHMTVNTLLYRTDGTGWWKNVSPLKLHEYLATGLPVVSADVDSVREFAAVIDIVVSQQEWLDALDRAIAGCGVGSFASRQKVAFENDWNERIDRIEILLQALSATG